jgi:hypothetical protein
LSVLIVTLHSVTDWAWFGTNDTTVLPVVLHGCRTWSSALKVETVCSPETLVSTYKFTWRYYPEDQHRRLHRRENLKSHHTAVLGRCLVSADATEEIHNWYLL